LNELNYCPKCSGKLVEEDIDGRIRKYCSSCKSAVYENPVPATAAVCRDDAQRVLLVKRSVEPQAGKWCLPGGFVEIDESAEEGCLRELKEETGLSGRILSDAKNVRSESPFYSSVIVMGYLVEVLGGKLAAGDDSSEAKFFSLAEFPEIAFESHRIIIDHF